MRQRLIRNSLLIIVLLLASSANTFAAVSKSAAASIAQQRFPGRVLAINTTKKDTGNLYKVKILDKKGEVHIVIIDAASGRVISAY